MVGGTAAGLVDATTGEGIHEAAMTGRLAAAAVSTTRRGRATDPAPAYERSTKNAFYGRLRNRHMLMSFLEKRPARFDVLFDQMAGSKKFSELLQHDKNDFNVLQWMYLYAQVAKFAMRALRV
jgi:flavin-dependent dehydrogenase